MAESVEISITLEQDDFEKLRKLAGSEAAISEYLARMIQRLYSEHRIFGEVLDFDHLISAAERIAHQNKDYEESVRKLQDRLKKLTMSQEELMATVDHLRTVSAGIRKSTTDRTIH